MTFRTATIGLLLVLATTPGCAPCSVFGPLQHQRDERDLLLLRSRGSALPIEVVNVIAPPLTPAELQAVDRENHSCRVSYIWKNALTWTGGVLVAVAAGVTVGGAYGTAINDSSLKIAFGVSAGTLAALGGVFGVLGGIVHQSFTERGCVVK
ncbi:MAG TPA: hypothetical protein VN894_04525 [Polyangiaceae bacterium]|nr:hypothetical protein [Polyangiaceae bacterium]